MSFEDDGVIRDEVVRMGISDYYKFKIFERRSYFIEAFEIYNKRIKRNIQTSSHIVETALESLYLEAGIFLNEALAKKPNELLILEQTCENARTSQEFKKAFKLLDKYFYKYNILTNETDRISTFTLPFHKSNFKGTKADEIEEIFEE